MQAIAVFTEACLAIAEDASLLAVLAQEVGDARCPKLVRRVSEANRPEVGEQGSIFFLVDEDRDALLPGWHCAAEFQLQPENIVKQVVVILREGLKHLVRNPVRPCSTLVARALKN